MGFILIQAEQRLPLVPKLMTYILTPQKSPEISVGESKTTGGKVSEEIVFVKEDAREGRRHTELSSHQSWSL